MREMRPSVGSKGNNRGAESLPEVQESVLEHAPTEARQEEITEDWPIVKLVTSMTHADYDAVLAVGRKRYPHPMSELWKALC